MSCAGAGSVEVTGADVQAPPYAETPRPSRPVSCPDPRGAARDRRSRRDAPLRVLEVWGRFRSTLLWILRSHAARPAASVQRSQAPRAGGRLSAAAGCGEHTARWSPTVTTTQSARLSEPWQRHSEARAAARAEAVVARSVAARPGCRHCDSALGLLGGRFRASTITCCMGTGRAEGPLRPRSHGRRLARRSGHLVPAGTRAAPYRPKRHCETPGSGDSPLSLPP